jgi:signal transduction histidine kinase
MSLSTACLNNKDVGKAKHLNHFYDKAYEFREAGMSDSAFLYYNKAKDLSLSQKDSVGVFKSLVNMGYITKIQGDYLGAQELCLSAIKYFDQNDKDQMHYIHSNFNTLALSCYQLKEYREAIKFINLALKYAKGYDRDIFLYLNNKAKIFEELREFNKAISIYEHVLKGPHKDQRGYARVLVNSAFAKWLQNSTYNPAPELMLALAIRKRERDVEGLNHSYARLSDYYENINKDSALVYAVKMHEVAKELNSPDDILEALEKLVKLNTGLKSKQYFVSYRKLEDSVMMARNKSKNQFALIRYETEKHKADNLVLQKDNTEKKYQLIKQKAVLVVGLAFAFFAIILSYVLYKKRKQRLELASKNAIRENQLKTSKKVHDVVANGLYRVMAEIENNENLNKDQVLDKLEDMYEKSRDLSYEEVQYTDKKFHEKVGVLLKSFAGENIKVIIIGNTSELWKRVNSEVKYEIEHILQELMVNMKKHSSASNVAIRFEQKQHKISIYYTDNGVGMLPEQQFNNGLTNTGNRIIAIDGEITFESKVEKGLKIQITFPIS